MELQQRNTTFAYLHLMQLKISASYLCSQTVRLVKPNASEMFAEKPILPVFRAWQVKILDLDGRK